MSEFKHGDRGFIASSYVSAICGEGLYEVEIISMTSEFGCQLISIHNDKPIGESFQGDIRGMFKTKNEAIDEMIKNLQECKE